MVAWCAIGLLSLFIPPNCKPQSTYPLLNTAASILALTNTEADQKHPAAIDGVITSSTEYGLFVQDRTAGIWVDWKNPRQFLPGDRVLVEGTSTAGLFSPDFAARRVTVIGRLPLPTPRRPNMKRLLAGDYNDQYVVITGLVRSVALRPNVSPPQRVWLKLLVDGDFIYATLPLEAYGAAEHLYGARVRIEAPASCTKNLNRQITAAMLSIPDIHHVTIVRPPPRDLFDEPETSIGGLMHRLGLTHPEILRLQVTAALEAALELQAEGFALDLTLLVPLASSEEEIRTLAQRVREIAADVFFRRSQTIGYQLSALIESPRAAICAAEIARHVDAIAFGMRA